MPRYDFDMFTIGAGSGGVASSRRAGAYGARVAICEELRVGGTCVLRGCVPKKLLVYSAQFADAFADAEGFGWAVRTFVFEWPGLHGVLRPYPPRRPLGLGRGIGEWGAVCEELLRHTAA